jgi:hypothetical protein
MLTCDRRPYASTNSGPATTAGRAPPSRSTRALPPPPLPFDHSPQRLTARRAAEPLAWAPLRGREVLFTPRTVAAKKSGIVAWALALGRRRCTSARGIRLRGVRCRGFCGLPALGAATPVTLALRLAFLLTVGGLTVLPAGPPSPPATSRRAALGATVPSLRVGGSKALLAPLEQTTSLSGPTSPLTSPGIAASWIRAQGSGELPTAKPRTRSPLCSAPRRLHSPLRPSWPIPSLHHKADRSDFQATPAGATSPKPTDFGPARSRRKSCALPGRY